MPTWTRTFGQSTSQIQRLCGNRILAADVQKLYNIAYREIVSNNQWNARLGESVVNTVDSYSAGTITATKGSTTILGSGVTFTAAMIGRYIRINGVGTFYRITGVASPNLTIEIAWPFETIADIGYEIFQYIYSLPAECGQPLLLTEQDPIEGRSLAWVNNLDPDRYQTDDVAIAWIGHGEGTDAATAFTRKFGESLTILTLLTESKIPTADLQALYNSAYEEVVSNNQWFSRISATVINTVDPDFTGTVSITQGTDVLTGTGTSWTTGYVGRYVRINQSWAFFKLIAVDPIGQTAQLEATWPYTTVVNEPYEIFQYIYALPSDVSQPIMLVTAGP